MKSRLPAAIDLRLFLFDHRQRQTLGCICQSDPTAVPQSKADLFVEYRPVTNHLQCSSSNFNRAVFNVSPCHSFRCQHRRSRYSDRLAGQSDRLQASRFLPAGKTKRVLPAVHLPEPYPAVYFRHSFLFPGLIKTLRTDRLLIVP